MAKHFKQDVGKTTRAPRPQATIKRARVATRSDDEEPVSLPYGDAAPYRTAYADPIRKDAPYYSEDEGFARGGIHRVGRGLFLLLAWGARLAALVLFVIVMLNAMPIPVVGPYVLTITDQVTSYLPWREMRLLVVDTPFSGAFRCDLCLLSLFLLVLDWVFCRIRAALV